MPEFNRKYTYGIGRYSYTLVFRHGSLYLKCTELGRVHSPEAMRYHLSGVAGADGFRYLD